MDAGNTDRGRQDGPPVHGRSERRQVAVRRAWDLGIDQGPRGQSLEAVDELAAGAGLVVRRGDAGAVHHLGELSGVAPRTASDAPAAQCRPALHDRTVKQVLACQTRTVQ